MAIPDEMNNEMKFFIYLLEYYAYHKNRRAGDVLREWNEHGITEEIYDGYFQYHQERMENAVEDIDSLVATGEHAEYWRIREIDNNVSDSGQYT